MPLSTEQMNSIIHNITEKRMSLTDALKQIGMEYYQYNNKVTSEQRQTVKNARYTVKIAETADFQPAIKQPKAPIVNSSLKFLLESYKTAKEVERMMFRNFMATARTSVEIKQQILAVAKEKGIEVEDIKMEE